MNEKIGYFDSISDKYAADIFYKNCGTKFTSDIELAIIEKNIPAGTAAIALDLGVGPGRISEILVRKADKVIAVDGSEKMLENARKKFSSTPNIEFVAHDLAQPLPFTDCSFSLVTCIRVIKYIKNWEALISEIHRVLKKGGILIIEFPNATSIARLGIGPSGYSLFFLKAVEKCLSSRGFKILKKCPGLTLPFPLYSHIGSQPLLSLAKLLESFSSALTSSHFARNMIYVCERE